MAYSVNNPRVPHVRNDSMRGWIICLLAAVFYMYEYFLRIFPSVMSEELMSFYGIHATGFGTLAALYYLIYAPMQVPVGVLMDNFGPRRLLTLACAICALGAFAFVMLPHFWMALVGRALIGFGSAFAFIGVLKLASIWLPPERFGFIAGLISALGALSGVVGDVSLTAVTARIGWQQGLMFSGLAGILLTVLIWTVIRDGRSQRRHKAQDIKTDFKEMWAGLLQVIKGWQIWWVGLLGCLIYLPTTSFAENWGINYLSAAHHLSPEQAAWANSLIFIGFGIGAPIMGSLSDRIGKRVLPIVIGSTVAALIMAWLLLGLGNNNSPRMVYMLLFALGVSYSVQPLVFVIGRELNPDRYSGTAVAMINALGMMGGMIFPRLIGDLLDMHWDLKHTGDLVHYTTGDYQVALAVIPIGLLVGAFMALWVREPKAHHKTMHPTAAEASTS